MSATGAKTFDDLWPESNWTDTKIRAFWRRVESLPLSTEQIIAVLEEYAMECRWRSPVPKDLLERLRVVAYPATAATHSPGSSDYKPTPIVGEQISLSEFVRRKGELGEAVHPMLRLAARAGPEQRRREDERLEGLSGPRGARRRSEEATR
jgi:hypothetical protein